MIGRREWGLVVLVWLTAMAVAFREPLLSGLDLGFGDRADGIIEISLLEHWRNVLTGHAAWHSPIYFHPHVGTLGYNDGYLLFGLIYSVWRIWFDPFLADTLNAATFKTIGFFASWWLVRRTCGWQALVALLVAALLTIGNAMTIHAVHAQLQSLGLLPLAMILAIHAVRAELFNAHGRARITAITLALLLGAWLLTAYYTAWFTLWFAAVFALSWLLVSGHWRPRAAITLLRAHGTTLAVFVAAFAIATIPFLFVYLPKASESGGHGYWKMLGYLVTPIDLVNTGPGNFLWGWINLGARALVALFSNNPAQPGKAFGGEHESGFPVFLFALVMVAAWRVLRGRFPADPVLRSFALAVIASWALTLQLWVFSPWGAVFHLVPGAKGLRVVLRYQIFLILPVLLLVAAVWRDKLAALLRDRPVIATAIVILLLGEQLTAQSSAQLSRAEHGRAVAAVPPPPAECASFYVLQTRIGEPLYRNAEMNAKHPHNVDAMFLAQRWRVPTINGYSTFQPPDWNFTYPLRPDYDARVLAYARSHRLRALCRLDVRNARPWRRVS